MNNWNMNYGKGEIFYNDLETALSADELGSDVAEYFCERYDAQLHEMEFVSADLNVEDYDVDMKEEYDFTSWGSRIRTGYSYEATPHDVLVDCDGHVHYAELVVVFKVRRDGFTTLIRSTCVIDFNEYREEMIAKMLKSEDKIQISIEPAIASLVQQIDTTEPRVA